MSADDLAAQGRRATWSDVVLRPSFRFWRDYLLHGSILDGRLGVIHAGMSAASVFSSTRFSWSDSSLAKTFLLTTEFPPMQTGIARMMFEVTSRHPQGELLV